LVDATPAQRRDAGYLQHAAHRLLGAARTLGATRLAACAEALQKALRAGDLAPGLQAEVIAVARATLPRLEAHIGADAALPTLAAALAGDGPGGPAGQKL
jgi:HPt (histidine-containing phosphotransfer) domain-containing protein